MILPTLFCIVALALPAVAAPTSPATSGSAIVHNRSGQSIWITSVASKSDNLTEVADGNYWTQPLYFDPATGVAIKIGTWNESVYTAGASELTFAYTLNNNENSVYYDLSTVNAVDNLWKDKKLTLAPSKGDCPSIVWDHIQDSPPQNTKACFGDTDLTLTLGA